MTRKKRIALATLPVLALVVLGSSVSSVQANFGNNLTEEQRSALEEARVLRKEGSGDDARKVLREAGLNPGMHVRGAYGLYGGKNNPMHAQHEEMKRAIEDNDFDAFKLATADAPFADMVTEENFQKLVEAHILHESGDKEGARAVLQSIDFPGGHSFLHDNKGGHRGWQNGRGSGGGESRQNRN